MIKRQHKNSRLTFKLLLFREANIEQVMGDFMNQWIDELILRVL